MNNTILGRLRGIFTEILSPQEVEALSLESTMDNTEGWDSLNFLTIIMGIESEFDLRIDGLDAADLVSVANIVSYLEAHTQIADNA